MYFWLEILRSPSSVYLSPSRPARKVGSAGLLCPLLACDLYFHWGWSVRQFSLRESLSGGPAKHTKLSCALTIASRGLPRSCASRYPPPFGLRQPLKLYVSLWRIRLPTAQVMLQSITVTHSQVLPLVLGRPAGLRLLGSGSHSSCLVTARRLWSHLAHAVSLWGCVVFHPAANPAVKLTRQRRAAYFVR